MNDVSYVCMSEVDSKDMKYIDRLSKKVVRRQAID